MKNTEWAQILTAVLLLFIISSLPSITRGDPETTIQILIFSAVIIIVPTIVRKAAAYSLDSSAKHRIWHFQRYGIRPGWHFNKEVPIGLILPIFFAIMGFIARAPLMVMTFLTYETRALKHRAAKRFGHYSYTSMTDWHNGLIGAAGIVAVLLISLISYFPGWEVLSKMAAYYAFWNMIPLSTLDGTQIFFGSRILYSVLGVITLIFTIYAMII